jgi:ABC-2 type transport system permease protein
MKNIIKLEFIKTLGYPGFRTIIILHAALFFLVVTIGSQISLNIQGVRVDKLFAFPYVWGTLSWIGSWFNLLLGILAIVLVSNEYQFRTFRKQIIDGVSRSQLLLAKMVVIATLALYALLLVLLTGFIFGIIFSNGITVSSIFEKFPYVMVLFVQSFAYMMLGMLFGFIFRNSGLSIITFILFFFPGEPILRAFFPSEIDQFFPIKIISNLTPMPDFVDITTRDMMQINGSSPASLQKLGLVPESLTVGVSTLVCFAYIIIFYFAIKLIIERRSF